MQKIKLFITLALIFEGILSTNVQAQPSTSQNYVITNGVKLPGITSEAAVNSLPIATQGKVQTITYFDGLGRPLQAVVTNGSASQKDLVTGIEYDQYSREITKYLPFSDLNNLGSSGSYRSGWKTAQATFYNGSLQGVDIDAAPYSLSVVEPSPFNRIFAQGSPGSVWQPNTANAYDNSKHTIQFQYLISRSTDNVRIFKVDTMGNISASGFYTDGMLTAKLTTDEQGQSQKEFTDKIGHIILKRVYIANDSLQTYYVYNDLDKLAAIIQPEGVAAIGTGSSWTPPTGFLGNWVFLYRYDQRGRIVMQKVPGADSVLMVYDQWDRVVLTQDGNLRTQSTNNWLFTKYDQLNRPSIGGFITDTRSQSAIRSDVANATGRYETVNTSATEGYTLNNTFPSSSSYTITVNSTKHYDSYSNIPTAWASSYSFVNEYNVASQNVFVQDQVVASQSKIIGTSNFIRVANYYDDKYQSTQVISDNWAGGKDRITKILSFEGKPLNDYHNHTSRFYTTALLIQQSYTYDHEDRLLNVTHQIGTQEIVTLSQNTYNELGQLLNKKLHQSPSHPNYLQKLDYTYNIRGWLNGINRPDPSEANYDESDLFNLELHYNTTQLDQARAQFNGNIAETVWKGGYDEYEKGYRHYYDAANRLDSSWYGWKIPNQWGANWDFERRYDEYLHYDHNGNITQLTRYHGDYDLINDLHYYYNGNRLGRIDDWNPNPNFPFGFKDKTLVVNSVAQDDYGYDANGNMQSDYNKSITSTTYNFLNLPTLVTITGKGTIAYTYDAAGNKLQKTTTDQTVTPNKVTNYYYAGEFVYRNDTVEYISHEDGRLRPVRIDTTQAISISNLKYLYDYFLKDHLGSTRSVITTEQETDVYAATMESSAATKENQLFNNISSTTTSKPGGFDTDNTNAQVSILNGNINVTGNKRVGPAIVLKVMAGDTISISTYAWYSGSTQQPPTGLSPIINDLLPLLTNGAVATGATHAGAFVTSDVNDQLNDALSSFLTNTQTPAYNTSKPKAFLNWMVVDEEFLPVSSSNHLGAVQVPTISGSMQKQQLIGPSNMVVRRNGWIYVYLSNEANQNVYFDNLVINHKRGPLVEQKDYYSFGMEIPGLSTQAAKSSSYNQNRHTFNNIEHDTAFGLDNYEALYRNFDPEIGRFWQVDPKIDELTSPYAAMKNNPISNFDPLGDTSIYYNSKGELLFTFIDNLENAITVVPDDQMQTFMSDFMNNFVKKVDEGGDIDPSQVNTKLRSDGISYSTDEYFAYYDKHSKETYQGHDVNNGRDDVYEANDKKGELKIEHAAAFNMKNGYRRIDESTDDPGDPVNSSAVGGTTAIHTHTNEGRKIKTLQDGGGRERGTVEKGKHGLDKDIKRARDTDPSRGIFRVVVSPTHIYLYTAGKVVIAVDRKLVPSKNSEEIR